jgi:hypothetical protein
MVCGSERIETDGNGKSRKVARGARDDGNATRFYREENRGTADLRQTVSRKERSTRFFVCFFSSASLLFANFFGANKKTAKYQKKGALMCLKKKKLYESQVERIYSACMTIEQQIMTIDEADFNIRTLESMKIGAQSLATINNNMTVDDVDDVREETREQMEVADEIGKAICQPLASADGENDVEGELEALEKEVLEETLQPIANLARLPIPATPIEENTQTVKQPSRPKRAVLV